MSTWTTKRKLTTPMTTRQDLYPKKAGHNYKKLSASNANFAVRVSLLVKYTMEFGAPNPVRSYVTPNNVRLGDWLHEQCKKYKAGRLSESCVKTHSALYVQFEKQMNVVGKQYTVATVISAIHKFEREHGHIKVKNAEDPHLDRWIMHAKAVSATIIEQGYGNDKFTLPYLISLHKLGLIVLPPKFKLQPEPMQKGTMGDSVLSVEKTTTTNKMKITKVAAPTKMRKMTQKVPALTTHTSQKKKKPSH
jgi:hypothetical protein